MYIIARAIHKYIAKKGIMIILQLKDIPLIGNYLPSNKTINTNKYELINIDNNYYMKFKYNSSEDYLVKID